MKYMIWVICYLVFALIFSQGFKKVNRTMKNASALTVLLELFTGLFAIVMSIFFKYTFPSDIKVYITLFVVTIIYSVTDRLNIEARYGLSPSNFSMLKQLSTVFLVIFGLVFLKEQLVFKKILGAIIIVVSNVMLAVNKDGKFEFNKYFIFCLISNFLFAVAMFINVNISSMFNIGIYTLITVFIPSIIIKLFSRLSFKDLEEEFNLYNKPLFILVSFAWCMMLISSVKAYEYGSISVVAPLLTLTALTNTIYEFIVDKDKKRFYYKLVISILILIGVILIKV
ncbi:MAG: hypothetical protein SO009_05535 [Bacilli bacterium]|nr:hypothetical protein [Bacilli bacterium]